MLFLPIATLLTLASASAIIPRYRNGTNINPRYQNGTTTLIPRYQNGTRSHATPEHKDGTDELATFDDIKALPALSELSPIGVYKGLEYRSFDTLVAGLLGQVPTGVLPKSGNQVAVNGLTDNLLTGSGPAFIPANGNKALDLESLYFGCVVNSVETVTGVPTECTVAFTAYLEGQEVSYETINQQFNPENLLRAEMTKAVFPKTWCKMGKIEIAVVQALATSTLTGLLLDDVKYKVY
ncbi:uncharacterized protein RCC_03971 [Ramularia collo-cygni]|uniref:Uncharacterized protein n=1 Tax=Ramularia collo-cygni TaxID=112498 RepID=A0A2D3UQP5_9PEZI|nr:uncharacterized protein RCC_03971 [Ramularia collo-cygni]CZT18131.1 uncharacterized protein RCC_03971 [Ramularia collo-cygni]